MRRWIVRGFANKPIFRHDVVYPEFATKVPGAYEQAESIEKKNFKKLWDRVNQSGRLQSHTVQQPEGSKELKDPNYYEEHNLYGADHPITQRFEVDKETNLPYNIGFDYFIRELQQSRRDEARQDKLRDAVMKLGFTSAQDFLVAVGRPDISHKTKDILDELYSPKPEASYPRDISLQRFPESRQKPAGIEEVHPQAPPRSGHFFNTKIREAVTQKLYGMEPVTYEKGRNLTPLELKKIRHFRRLLLNGPALFQPAWLTSHLRNLKRKREKNITKATKGVKRELQDINRVSAKQFLFEDRANAETVYQLAKEHKKAPTFVDIMTAADSHVNSTRAYRQAHQQDEFERNYHFEPQYLNKTLDPQELTSLLPRESIHTQIVTGKFDHRLRGRVLAALTDSRESFRLQGYQADPHHNLPAVVYSELRTQPYHQHVLANQLKYWTEAMASYNSSGSVSTPLVPWEYEVQPEQVKAKQVVEKKEVFDHLGRTMATAKRKRARAVAWVSEGTGKIRVNQKDVLDYFPDLVSRDRLVMPFKVTGSLCQFDVMIRVSGGGWSGQAQAARLATAKALVKFVPDFESALRAHELLKPDGRNVERKKTSKLKARKSYTFVKR